MAVHITPCICIVWLKGRFLTRSSRELITEGETLQEGMVMGRGIERCQGKENINHLVKSPTSEVTKPCTVERLVTRNLLSRAIEGTERNVKFIRYCVPDKNTWRLCSSKKYGKEN